MVNRYQAGDAGDDDDDVRYWPTVRARQYLEAVEQRGGRRAGLGAGPPVRIRFDVLPGFPDETVGCTCGWAPVDACPNPAHRGDALPPPTGRPHPHEPGDCDLYRHDTVWQMCWAGHVECYPRGCDQVPTRCPQCRGRIERRDFVPPEGWQP